MSIKCQYGPTNTYIVATPLGDYEVVCCPKGLHDLGMVGSVNDANFTPKPGIKVCLKSQQYEDNGYTYKPATDCVNWLEAYFSTKDKRELVTPAICHHIGKQGTFTYNVWFTLLEKVPFGHTISYGALAKLCGNSKACRAVGQAMRNNPVGLIIPCHRVIQEGGQLGNYHHGTRNRVKEWLLKHEGALR
ncbi:methylated-DNA--protein-cysteine methyltransferase-like [Mya arenaria]|uniref:methylated-DNA--protein-cysteine methyltransferase-like n=1 Tax=Mya arenaria TaxID=6604 RepID=UPI0022DF0503|nr:methylated-DNA--protein-cysteine methyltransferase-like [Mya arenaria]